MAQAAGKRATAAAQRAVGGLRRGIGSAIVGAPIEVINTYESGEGWMEITGKAIQEIISDVVGGVAAGATVTGEPLVAGVAGITASMLTKTALESAENIAESGMTRAMKLLNSDLAEAEGQVEMVEYYDPYTEKVNRREWRPATDRPVVEADEVAEAAEGPC